VNQQHGWSSTTLSNSQLDIADREHLIPKAFEHPAILTDVMS
jgi:hypothetical protein